MVIMKSFKAHLSKEDLMEAGMNFSTYFQSVNNKWKDYVCNMVFR